MIINEIVYKKNNYREQLLNELKNNIFHLTSTTNFLRIQKDGIIYSNMEEKFPLNISSEGSFGRRKGWVCLFDLINISDDKINTELTKYNFLDSSLITNSNFSNEPVYFILNPQYYDDIIQYDYAIRNKIIDVTPAQYIPFIECWYPGDLHLEKIIKVLIVKFRY